MAVQISDGAGRTSTPGLEKHLGQCIHGGPILVAADITSPNRGDVDVLIRLLRQMQIRRWDRLHQLPHPIELLRGKAPWSRRSKADVCLLCSSRTLSRGRLAILLLLLLPLFGARHRACSQGLLRAASLCRTLRCNFCLCPSNCTNHICVVLRCRFCSSSSNFTHNLWGIPRPSPNLRPNIFCLADAHRCTTWCKTVVATGGT
mmetsp:Transcript_102697/g.329192  ORF Transcript_102697/g.329192 Transcript_102697/m.329192 type:complete len:203 (+) Transcript_102697:1638-2246(+)